MVLSLRFLRTAAAADLIGGRDDGDGNLAPSRQGLLKVFGLLERQISSEVPVPSFPEPRDVEQRTQLHQEEDVIFRIISSSSSTDSMLRSLESSGIPLSNPLVDSVLKRVRFSHGNPLKTLDFFSFAGKHKSFFHTSFSYDTMLYILGRGRRFQEAWNLLHEMTELGVKPDLVTYNCLVEVYCKNREMDKAYKVLNEMRKKEFCPDVFTHTSIIGGLGLVGQPDKAREVLKDMKELGCHPDAAAYNAAIRNYCIAKRLGNAFELMEEMEAKGLGPSATTYNLFFRCFYWANDLESAWRLYKKMRKD